MLDSWCPRDASHQAVHLRLQTAFRIEPQATFAEAENLYLRGLHHEALAACRKLLAHDPAAAAPLHLAGVICLDRKEYDLAAAYLRRAEAADQADARVQYHLGNAEMSAGRTEAAMAHFERAFRLDPMLIDAVNNLGTCHRTLGQEHEAIACFEQALRLNQDFAPAHYNLGLALSRTGRAEEALPHFALATGAPVELAGLDRVLETRDALGGALMMMGRHEEALEVARARTALKPEDPTGQWHEALILLSLGRFAEGLPLYERRWQLPGFRPDDQANEPPPHVPDRSSLVGARVHLRSEQGHGDTLQFARYAELVRRSARTVTLSVRPEMLSLMATLPWVDAIVADGAQEPEHDLAVHLLSLPLVFGTEMRTISAPVPYLSAPTERLARWRDRLGEPTRPRIGIAWHGAQHLPERSIPFGMLDPLLRLQRFAFHSLQKATPPPDLALMNGRVTDHGAALQDFADTAALIRCMDLVVTIDTSVAHLAGALGAPVWILLQRNADWRWFLHRAESPWYPTARLFRQTRQGQWHDVIAAVTAHLQSATLNQP